MFSNPFSMERIHAKFENLLRDNNSPITKEDNARAIVLLGGLNEMANLLSTPKDKRNKHDEILLCAVRSFLNLINTMFVGNTRSQEDIEHVFKSDGRWIQKWIRQEQALREGKTREQVLVDPKDILEQLLSILIGRGNQSPEIIVAAMEGNCICGKCKSNKEQTDDKPKVEYEYDS